MVYILNTSIPLLVPLSKAFSDTYGSTRSDNNVSPLRYTHNFLLFISSTASPLRLRADWDQIRATVRKPTWGWLRRSFSVVIAYVVFGSIQCHVGRVGACFSANVPSMHLSQRAAHECLSRHGAYRTIAWVWSDVDWRAAAVEYDLTDTPSDQLPSQNLRDKLFLLGVQVRGTTTFLSWLMPALALLGSVIALACGGFCNWKISRKAVSVIF